MAVMFKRVIVTALLILLGVSGADSLPNSNQRFLATRPLEKLTALENLKRSGSADPQPCCWPAILQAHVYGVQANDDQEYFFNFSMDANNGLLAYDETDNNLNGMITTISYIFDFKAFVAYAFHPKLKWCAVGIPNIPSLDDYRCIPKDAKYTGDVSVGIFQGGAGLCLNAFNWTDELADNCSFMTTKDCAPVIISATNDGIEWLFTQNYYDLKTTIDRHVFVVPPYCPHTSNTPRGDSAQARPRQLVPKGFPAISLFH